MNLMWKCCSARIFGATCELAGPNPDVHSLLYEELSPAEWA
jgi:hypothetical protein